MRLSAAFITAAVLVACIPTTASASGPDQQRSECGDSWHVVAVKAHTDTTPTFTEQQDDPDLEPVDYYFARTERIELSKRCAGEFRMRVEHRRWAKIEAPAPPPVETDSDQTRPGCQQEKWRTVVHRAPQVDQSPGFVPADQAADAQDSASFARGQWVTARKKCGAYRFVIRERRWQRLDAVS